MKVMNRAFVLLNRSITQILPKSMSQTISNSTSLHLETCRHMYACCPYKTAHKHETSSSTFILNASHLYYRTEKQKRNTRYTKYSKKIEKKRIIQ